MKQTDRLNNYLKEFGSITPLQAMRDLGIMRLAARIAELKKDGARITTNSKPVKNRWGETTRVAEYMLEEIC